MIILESKTLIIFIILIAFTNKNTIKYLSPAYLLITVLFLVNYFYEKDYYQK